MNKGLTVGKSLRELRVEMGLSLKKAAPIVNISYTYLSKIENDQKVPTPGLVLKLCKLYKSESDDLIAKLGAMPREVEDILKEHGKDAFDLLRNSYIK